MVVGFGRSSLRSFGGKNVWIGFSGLYVGYFRGLARNDIYTGYKFSGSSISSVLFLPHGALLTNECLINGFLSRRDSTMACVKLSARAGAIMAVERFVPTNVTGELRKGLGTRIHRGCGGAFSNYGGSFVGL